MDNGIMASLSDSPTPQQNSRNVSYFEQMRASETGWKLCLESILNRTYSLQDPAQFFCISVIESYVKERYNEDSADNQEMVRNLIRMWPSIQSPTESAFIVNKMAQVTALVFIQDFPHRWSGFFNDISSCTSQSEEGVDFYLRVLKAIDNEVADRDIVRSPAEVQRNNTIKDAIRQSSIVNLVTSWYHILLIYEPTKIQSKQDIAKLCHQVIGAYIRWIDINLIANDNFVRILVKTLNHEELRESAAECIYDIISKGMDPVSKVNLVESFSNLLSSVGIWQAAGGLENNADYLMRLGQILNGMGTNLIEAHNKLFKATGSTSTESTLAITQAIEDKFALLVQFLGNEDDDVSASVLDFLRDYLHFLKAKTVLTEIEMYHIVDLVKVVVAKVRFDSEYDFDNEGEDEACFKEFRKQLKTVIENLISVDKPLVVDQMRVIITETLQNWRQLPFENVEGALYVLHVMGESVPPALSHFNADPEKYSILQKILLVLANSDVHLHMHTAVAIQYFEVVVRYEKFYLQHAEFIVQVLTTFLKTSGLFHPDRKVRSRSAYLLSRFIKSMRAHITPELTQEILTAVQPLMEIFNPSSYGEPPLSEDDQLYVYEVVGVVILAGETEQQKRMNYMQLAVMPLLETYRDLIRQISPMGVINIRRHTPPIKTVYRMLVQIISVVGRLSKAFSPQDTMKSCGCIPIFVEALNTFLKARGVIVPQSLVETSGEIMSAIRQYFHRLVVCLDTEILPLVAPVSSTLLEFTHFQEYIPLITQIIAKFKKEVTPFLKTIFPPLVTRIFGSLDVQLEENDETGMRDKLFATKQYFQLISSIVGNNLTEVLPMDDEPLLNKILDSIIRGACCFPDPVAQKTCFSILKKLVEVWGGPDGPPGFLKFMYNDIVNACFMGPSQPTFDMNDAQSILVINETVACMKAILEKRGSEFVVFLRTQYFPSINMCGPDIEEYLFALQGNLKEFRFYVKNKFLKLKSSSSVCRPNV